MHAPDSIPRGTVFAKTGICEVGVDPSVGNLPKLVFHWGDQTLEPLHRAPWVEDATFPDAMPPVDRKLSGDFVCAPFGLSDVEAAPPHGWTANAPWNLVEQSADRLRFELSRTVMRARITKVLEPSVDAPLLYQTHHIAGGNGGLTFAHHPMFRVAGGARFFCSPKRVAITPDPPIVEERHRLVLGAQARDLTRIPDSDGGTIDATQLPIGAETEDFITLIEAEGSSLGWTALLRETFDDLVFVLKDPRILPVTMLWHSNGGREDEPWSGRHTGVLGIEDGIAAGAEGHRAALGDNQIRQSGVKTALKLDDQRSHRIAHVIGAVPRPKGWRAVRDIRIAGDALLIEGGGDGQLVELPFRPDFLNQ